MIITENNTEEIEPVVVNQNRRFQQDIHDIVTSGIKEKKDPENIQIEINSTKYAFDRDWGDCGWFLFCFLLFLFDPYSFLLFFKRLFRFISCYDGYCSRIKS